MARLHAFARRHARLAGALILLAIVVATVRPHEIASLLGRANVGPLLVGLGLVQLQILASAVRWRFTARRLGVDLSLPAAIREYYLASFVNLAAPGAVAGDVLRAVRTGGSRAAVVRSVVLERLAGQVALLALTSVGIGLAAGLGFALPDGAALIVGLVGGGLVVGALGLATAGRYGPARIRRALDGLWPDVRRAWFAGAAPLVQGGLSLGIAAGYVAAFAAAAVAIGAPLPVGAVVTLVPLALLAMVLPISVAGFGAREGAAALLWPLAGLTAAEGAVTAALYGLVALAGALPGALALLAPHPPTRA